MKVIAAYLLAVLGGNASPSADDVKDILCSGTNAYSVIVDMCILLPNSFLFYFILFFGV